MRSSIGAVLLIVVGVVSTAGPLRDSIARRRTGEVADPVAAYAPRFAEIRRALPRRGVVGYLSDRMDAVKEYYVTQHLLAPLVVRPSPDADLVIGNFFEPETAARLVPASGLVVLHDYGDGLLLLGRRGP